MARGLVAVERLYDGARHGIVVVEDHVVHRQ
jgi:hypothetical protein